MEDDLEFSNLCVALVNDPGSSCFMPMDGDTPEGLTVACTHTHTCNQPVDDPSHTHTCVHVHTKTVGVVVPPPPPNSAADGASASQPPPENASNSKKKPPPSASRNRVAVRKYRQKKKAQAVSLEEEVAHLRASTQQLLNTNAALHEEALSWKAEADRLSLLLADIGGRIQGGIGVDTCFQQHHNVHRPPVISSSSNIVDLQVSTGGGGVANNNHGHGVLGAGAAAAAQGTSSSCDFRRCNDQIYYHYNPAGTGSMQGAFRGHHQVVGVGHGACHGANIRCTAGSSTSSRLPPQPVSASHGHGGVDTGPAGGGGLPNVDSTSDGR